MGIYMSRRAWVRVISFAAAVLLTLSIWLLQARSDSSKYHTALQNGYSEASTQLCDYISRLDTDLNKQLFVSTRDRAALMSSELLRDASGAKDAISRLPLENGTANEIYRFLSQVGNYSLALSQKQSLSDSDRQTLIKLRDYCDRLSVSVEELSLTQDFAGWSEAIPDDISKTVENIAQTVSDYPTLIYDGPFSDSIDRKSPAYLADKLTVNVEKAQTLAAKYLGTAADKLKREPDEQSITPAFVFSQGERICAVTKTGGALLYITSSRKVGTAATDEPSAVRLAVDYLKRTLGMQFKESYFVTANGLCTVNFAYNDNGIICYPDLIKVSVALDNGSIEEVEARGFVMNHKERNLSAPKYSTERAARILNRSLSVKSSSLCVIDPNGTQESLCYEFYCVSDKDEILVYIDAMNLTERNMLIVTRTDGGTLTR